MKLTTTSMLLFFPATRFFHPPDDSMAGGGGDGQAESQIDDGGGDDGDGSDEHPEYALDTDESGRVTGAKPRTSPTGRAADDQGDRPKPGDSDRRLADLEKENREYREHLVYMRGVLEGRGPREGETKREAAERVELNEEQVAVQKEIMAIFPELAVLSRLAKDLFGDEEKGYKQLMEMVSSAPVMRRQQQEHWDGVADRFCSGATAAVAKLYGMDKLGDEATEDVEELFIKWVKSPKDKTRLQRYSRQDLGLVDEFAKYYEANLVSPARRQEMADEAARDERRQRLPRGGQGKGHVGQPKPKVDLNDEDAVHSRAWQRLQAARA